MGAQFSFLFLFLVLFECNVIAADALRSSSPHRTVFDGGISLVK